MSVHLERSWPPWLQEPNRDNASSTARRRPGATIATCRRRHTAWVATRTSPFRHARRRRAARRRASPGCAGPFPVLVAASPYPRQIQDLGAPMGFIEAGASDFWVPRGYVHVIANLRGTGGSGGTFGFFDAQERRDLHDLVEWAAAQPWCDGNVGMIGISYFAMTPAGGGRRTPPTPEGDLPGGRHRRPVRGGDAPRAVQFRLRDTVPRDGGADIRLAATTSGAARWSTPRAACCARRRCTASSPR